MVGNSHKEQLVPLMEGPDRIGFASPEEVGGIYWGEFGNTRLREALPASDKGQRTRPLVKIQDGCDAKCSYCIIPQVRGPSRSVPPQVVLQRVADLVRQGCQEVVLTGIHIGTYGMRWHPRYPLDRLLNEIMQLPRLGRLRLSSIEPMQLSRRVTALAADSEKISPHFHICLQSGSDPVLKRMLRPYSTARFAGIVEEIHRILPHAAIGTDLIAGFPGESEEDHRRTLAFVRDMPFSYLHVFPYSDRPGTGASQSPDKVRPQTLRRRSLQLRQLSEEKNRNFRRRFIGDTLSVLTLSERRRGMRVALSANYLKVKAKPSLPENRLVSGTVVGEDEEGYLLLETAAE